MDYQRERDLATKIARRAGEIALSHYSGTVVAEEKKDLSPVTAADRESEETICRFLADNFPDDGILGEEGASKPSRSGRRGLIDPIDGTRDYVRKAPFWSVQIALEDHGQIVAGVIHLPGPGETFHAVLGGGCFCNDVQVHASGISRLDKAVLTISAFKDAWHVWAPEQIRFLTQKCWTVRAYGGCYDVTMIARGKADIWLSGNGMEWDYAPAVVIAGESGARFFTRDGTSRINARQAVICAPALERELRKVLQIPE